MPHVGYRSGTGQVPQVEYRSGTCHVGFQLVEYRSGTCQVGFQLVEYRSGTGQVRSSTGQVQVLLYLTCTKKKQVSCQVCL